MLNKELYIDQENFTGGEMYCDRTEQTIDEIESYEQNQQLRNMTPEQFTQIMGGKGYDIKSMHNIGHMSEPPRDEEQYQEKNVEELLKPFQEYQERSLNDVPTINPGDDVSEISKMTFTKTEKQFDDNVDTMMQSPQQTQEEEFDMDEEESESLPNYGIRGGQEPEQTINIDDEEEDESLY